jgi:hypothetical protein
MEWKEKFEQVKTWVMNNKPAAIGIGLVLLLVIAFLVIRAKKKEVLRARLRKARAAKNRIAKAITIRRKPTSRESMAAKMARLRAMRGKKKKA